MKIFAIITFAICFCCSITRAVDLEPYESPEISVEQWKEYRAKVSAELVDSKSTFKYEAGELENYADPKSYTNISFTTPGHDAHPSWVATQIVVDGDTLTAKVIGYYAGDEAAYREFFKRMNEMTKRTLEASSKQ